MRSIQIKSVIFLSIILIQAGDLYPGIPDIEYFGTDQYNAGIQNYQITQDSRGIIFVANNLGLLEYDGCMWRRYRTEMKTKIRSVFIDASGNVFVGAQNEIGYFSPAFDGSYVYRSLNQLIPEDYADYEDVWNIYPLNDQLVFAASKKLFFLNKDRNNIEVMPIPDATAFTFKIRESLFSHFAGAGLKELKNKEWLTLNHDNFLAEGQLSGMIVFNKMYNLIATRDDGLYLINNSGVHRWAKSFNDEFILHKINTIYRLNDGSIAIGTNTNGLYVLNDDGELIEHFNKDRGLKNGTIHTVFQDKAGNIWLGLNNGIIKIDWNSPFSFINEEVGLPGTGYAAFSTDQYIYFGTNNGLYYTEKDKYPVSEIIKMEEIQGLVYNIQRIHDDILASCHFGLFRIQGDKADLISDQVGWWTISETRHPGLAICGTYDGLCLIKKTRTDWTIEKHYQGFNESSRVMTLGKKNDLWMTHGYKGAYSFSFTDNYENLKDVGYYNQSNGFPSNLLINVFNIKEELLFPAESGIYTYNPEKDIFESQHLLNKIIDPENHVRYMISDSFDNVYIITNDYTAIISKNAWDNYELDTSVFNVIHPYLNDDLENISILDHDNILFAAKDGFVHYHKKKQPYLDDTVTVLIRKIILTKTDSSLFEGNFNDGGQILNSQPDDQIPSLPFSNNSILLDFSAIDYHRNKSKYRYQLEGYDKKWSEWNKNTQKEYTNLPEGNYVFKVMARNIYDQTSGVQTYEFNILPPWYGSGWAYMSYIILSLGSLFSLLYFYREKYQREKRHLIIAQKRELIFKDNQLVEVSKKSQQEIDKLKNEKLKAEIKHKNKELATTTMHLIDKNNFINSIKIHINDLVKMVEEGKSAKSGLNRIVREINRNIQEDKNWHQFELYFDEVHADFLKMIRKDFPGMTPQEIKLSAFLRMNMSTKEIANLLKISVRGVEIARYRLRKKLKVERDTNLVDYMMNYKVE